MAHTTFMLTFFMAIFLLQLNFGWRAASRPVGIHPPAIPRGSLIMPKPPSIHWFTINRYKKVEADAFRPTSPGHSPGVGHEQPPAAP